MASALIYEPKNTPADVTQFLPIINTPDYEGQPNILINPDLSQVKGLDQKYWKIENGQVVPMSASEQSAVDTDNFNASVDAIAVKAKNFLTGTDANSMIIQAIVQALPTAQGMSTDDISNAISQNIDTQATNIKTKFITPPTQPPLQ